MSTTPAVRLNCDGECGDVIFGVGAEQVRRQAADAGWTFPPQLRSNGLPGTRSHDVCPACRRTFEPRRSKASSKWAEMSKEERRLVTFLRMNWNMVSPEERRRLEQKLADMRAVKA